MLKMDISALMGYAGAAFGDFFGTKIDSLCAFHLGL
jgi:hypothetical protein